jgi:hypothetical protein
MYDDKVARRDLLAHIDASILVQFTSGTIAYGRQLIEKEITDDLHFGSRFHLHAVSTCGNVSVIEGININSAEYPDRCPSGTVLVTFRGRDKIERLHFHHTVSRLPS